MPVFDWIKFIPWIGCIVLALIVALLARAYMGERDDFSAYRATVAEIGKKAVVDKKNTERVYADTLNTMRKDHEKKLPIVRANAVAAYKLRFPASGCPVPDAPSSIKVDDGASAKLVVDGTFVQDCADDAAKLTTWQAHCALNGCPVK